RSGDAGALSHRPRLQRRRDRGPPRLHDWSPRMITVERETRFVDKSAWGDGAWQTEPDKIQWTDEATGLPCLPVRKPRSGSWCGYVGVPEEHRMFGLSYDQASSLAADEYLRVHGGLTFAGTCQEGAEDTGICHIPQPGQPDKVWWLGFDCAHAGDI